MDDRDSSEIYEDYRKARMREAMIEKRKGGGLLMVQKSYSIDVILAVEANLEKREERLIIDHNLPFYSYSFDEDGTKAFFRELKEWASPIRYEFLTAHNRRRDNQPYIHEGFKFKTLIIPFESVKITVSENAKRFLTEKGIDFEGNVKKLLDKQRWATDAEAADFERFVSLVTRAVDLSRQMGSSDEPEYWSPNRSDDSTPRFMPMSYEDYDKTVLEILGEVGKLGKKYPFLEIPNITNFEKKGRGKKAKWIRRGYYGRTTLSHVMPEDEEEYSDEDEESDESE